MSFLASKRKSFQSIIFYLVVTMLLPFGKSQDFTNNLIVNGNFTLPIVTNRYRYFNSSILGWNCTWLCEIRNCTQSMKYWLPQHKIDNNCMGQVLDLNSDKFNEVVTQTVNLNAGRYVLYFNYYYPMISSRNKQMKVLFNNETLL